MSGFYILKGKTPVRTNDVIEWGQWLENNQDRHVAETTVEDIWISTVFLGLDYGWREERPILFETMIFYKHAPVPHTLKEIVNEKQPEFDGYQFQRRYSTWEEAEAGHAEAVQMVKKSLVEKVNVSSMLAQIQFEKTSN